MFDAVVNYWAVLVAAVVNMVVGFVWYSPVLFAKPWMKAMGWDAKSMEKMKKNTNMGKTYGLMFVGALVAAYVLSLVVDWAGATTWQQGAMVGFWVWLGFVATVGLGNVLFEGKNMTLFYISMGYQLVTLAIAGAILATWV